MNKYIVLVISILTFCLSITQSSLAATKVDLSKVKVSKKDFTISSLKNAKSNTGQTSSNPIFTAGPLKQGVDCWFGDKECADLCEGQAFARGAEDCDCTGSTSTQKGKIDENGNCSGYKISCTCTCKE